MNLVITIIIISISIISITIIIISIISIIIRMIKIPKERARIYAPGSRVSVSGVLELHERGWPLLRVQDARLLRVAPIAAAPRRLDLPPRASVPGARAAACPVLGPQSPADVERCLCCRLWQVLVLEADASAAGLTLTCARHVIFLDVLNSTLLEEQAMARVNRIGQTVETHVWHLVAKDSVDESLRDAADRKAPLQPGDAAPDAIVRILRRTAQKADASIIRMQVEADEAARVTEEAEAAEAAQLEAEWAAAGCPRVRVKVKR